MEDLSIEKTSVETPAQKFLHLIKQLIKEEQYYGIALLFTSEQEADRNAKFIDEVGMDLFHEICLPNLNDENHSKKFELYCCAQDVLKAIAAYAPAEELLLELLELVEDEDSEHVFTSTLRALQVVLLRMGDHKPRALEWGLNSIYSRLQQLPLPEYLTEGYDSKQERLLEQNTQIQALLTYYITVNLFYEPLVKDVVATRSCSPTEQIFHNNGITRRNVLCCFLIQLLGKPLSLLDLTVDERKTNTYTVQNAQNLTKGATQCIGDPYRLLALVEQRVRWKRYVDEARDVHTVCSSNIFLVEEKLPLDALAIYFYMLLVEEIIAVDMLPKVYAPLFIFEAGLYLATELLSHEEPALNMRAFLLTKRLLLKLQETPIPASFLELEVYKKFCYSLCNIVGFSSQVELRQQGVQLLRKYILQFDDEGKYLVLKNLLRSIDHTGISGFLAIMYKDLVADALVTSTTASLPTSFSGKDFRTIFLQNMCYLPQGVETDLIDYSDKIISSLNALRFFAIKDCNNRTGFWDFITDILQQFLDPLRIGLNISIAHYKAELERIEKGVDAAEDAAELAHLKMLDISIANASSEKSKVDLEINRQHKVNILNQNLCTFDLMRSLLARVTECVENSGKLCNLKKQAQHEICK